MTRSYGSNEFKRVKYTIKLLAKCNKILSDVFLSKTPDCENICLSQLVLIYVIPSEL